jgi:hypothetical protein
MFAFLVVLILGLGGYNQSDQLSFVELSGETTRCPKLTKFPIKISNSVGAFFDESAVICGGSLARSTG